MQYSWDHIRSFNAVVQHGSLLGAARKLGLTQPTVGRHIDLLEEAMGFALFTRGREGMRLTEKGADLSASSDAMSRVATDFERVASGLEENVQGTVRISANEIFGAMLLPELLADFLAAWPDIEVEIAVSNDASNLLQRDADIAVRMFRPTQNDLIARKVRELPMGLYAHEAYFTRHGAPSDLGDLSHHTLVGLDRSPLLIDGFRAAGLEMEPSAFRFRSDSLIAGITAVRAGIGIGPMHVELADKWPNLRRVLPELPVPSLDLWLVCHKDVRHNRRVRLLMDHLAERLKSPYAQQSE